MTTQAEMFRFTHTGKAYVEQPDPTRGLCRTPDAATSVEAAESIAVGLSDRQQQVFEAVCLFPYKTARELENLEAFRTWGASSVRKRISELSNANPPHWNEPRIRARGIRDGMQTWHVVEKAVHA